MALQKMVDGILVVMAPDEEIAFMTQQNPPPPPGPPVPAPPAIPASVTRKQAKLALVMTNHFDAVVTALSAIPGADGAAALIEWNDSETFERDSDFLRQMASTLGMSSADLDSLFTLAATL